MTKLIAVLAAIALAVAGGERAMSVLHIGAPDFYRGWHCPPGSFLKTWWIPAGPSASQETYVYRGWREIGGCASSVTITTGG